MKKNQILTQPLDAANAENDVANGQNAGSYMAEELGIEDPARIRPCIAIHFRDGLQRGFSPIGRDTAGFIIAVDLRRLRIGKSEARAILGEWNRKNKPNLTDRQIDKIVTNAFTEPEPYKYSCDHYDLSPTCVGRNKCPWAKRTGINRNKSLHSAFMAKGWMKILTGNAKLIYLVVLPILEGRRQVGTGGRIIAGYRDIADALGWSSHSSIAKYLKELADYRLVRFEPGEALRKKKIATTISRTIPVPDVPDIYRHKLQRKCRWSCSQ